MSNIKSLTPFLALAIGVLFSARGVSAHGGHNMEKIQEGEHMSADPIVGGLASQK